MMIASRVGLCAWATLVPRRPMQARASHAARRVRPVTVGLVTAGVGCLLMLSSLSIAPLFWIPALWLQIIGTFVDGKCRWVVSG